MLKRSFYFLIIFQWLSVLVFAQQGQIELNRISQMPAMPSPYLMRDWKKVAADYDEKVFSLTASGQYLPLIGLKSNGVNYPSLAPIVLQTYVGTNTANQAEAINIIPAVVSASLVGIDKENQDGVNWVEKTKDFYNKVNGQNVYLNGYNTNSGGDWWYDVMPNIFFYQLFTLYPSTSDYNEQFISIADQWLQAVKTMGGSSSPWTVPNMNYRAWNLLTMQGNADGVKEPEAAGAIAWILYNAYAQTGNRDYLYGAQQAMDFLNALTSNPSYELQLPYGVAAAAKMNAELGTQYNIEKMLAWCFDRGPLRGWGAIVGDWNGQSVDGLIGEANDNGNDYAFLMNGFQQTAALAPLIKYDKRFARTLSKWILNVSNASRLLYPAYLPANSQDDYTWSNTHDPESAIAYEALKELWEGKPLYGTGDAKRSGWAATNLGLYGSSHVGYLAAVVDTTDVEGVLLLNLNATDFFAATTLKTFSIYNPHAEEKEVTITLPAGTYDIYDAISETVIATQVSGLTSLSVKADEVLLITLVPSGIELIEVDGKLYADDEVVDFHYGYNFTPGMRIKALAATKTTVEYNEAIPVFLTTENVPAEASYKWFYEGELIHTSATADFTLTVPEQEGEKKLMIEISAGTDIVRDSILFTVMEDVPEAPVISNILPNDKIVDASAALTCQCVATDDSDAIAYSWNVTGGTLSNEQAEFVTWTVPSTEGIYSITCEAQDEGGLSSSFTKTFLVRVGEEAEPLAYYPLDGDVQDYSGNGYHANQNGVSLTTDARNEANKAYLFNAGDDMIKVPQNTAFNFQDKITASFWVKLFNVPEEVFILSHGSWEQRWKVSITPDGYLRWTIKTSAGTKDLDSSYPLPLNAFHHVTVVFTGFSMEVYINGELDTFAAHSGAISQSIKSITFGRKEEGETNYYLRGVIDEVRLYHAALSPEAIELLPDTWNVVTSIDENRNASMVVFPNPARQNFYIAGANNNSIIHLTDLQGKQIEVKTEYLADRVHVMTNAAPGIYLLSVRTGAGRNVVKLVMQ